MKIAIMELIKYAPVDLLKEYFINQSFAKDINWTGSNDEIFAPLVEAISKMADHKQEPLIIESERIHIMTDRIGQDALGSLVHENKEFRQMENPYHRALWVFLHDNTSFKYAEKIYYAEKYLQGGIMDGYIGPKDIDIASNSEQILLFEEEVGKFFMDTEDQRVEIFNRYIVNNIGKVAKVFQVLIHLQGAPESHIEFEGEDDKKTLATKITYPIENISITYEPEDGQVDIFFKGDESKKEIVKIFAQTLLQSPEGGTVTLKQYKIEKLMQPYEFVTDPEDGIESVKVMVITLLSLIDDNRITLECSPAENRSIHEVVHAWFKEKDLLQDSASFALKQVIIFIHLFSDRTNEREEILSLRITPPNGLEIMSKNIQERSIIEKYLQRWGLIEEI